MNILINDIRTFKEFTVRGCRRVSCPDVRERPPQDRDTQPSNSSLGTTQRDDAAGFSLYPLVCLQQRGPHVRGCQRKRHPHLLLHIPGEHSQPEGPQWEGTLGRSVVPPDV